MNGAQLIIALEWMLLVVIAVVPAAIWLINRRFISLPRHKGE